MKASARRTMEAPEAALERIAAGKRGRVTGWDAVAVSDALEDAFNALHRLPDRTKQRSVRSVWPDDTFALSPEEISWQKFAAEVSAHELGDEEMKDRAKDLNRVILLPDAHRISQMEKAITWPMRYVPHPMFRLIVLTVSITRARNGSVNKLCKDMGWPYTTAGHRFNKACEQIADGLERDAIPCWR